jgi:hypothetical protein
MHNVFVLDQNKRFKIDKIFQFLDMNEKNEEFLLIKKIEKGDFHAIYNLGFL